MKAEIKFISHKAMKDLRILYLTWHPPHPTDVGARQRSNLLYRGLSELGEVDLVVLNAPDLFSADELDVMRREYGLIGMAAMTRPSDFGFWRWLKPLAPRLVHQVAHNLNPARSFFAKDQRLISKLGDALEYGEYDVIVGRYARSLAKLGLPQLGLPPVVLDIDDLDTDVYESRLRQEGQGRFAKLILSMHLYRIRKAENKLLSQIKYLWVANPDNLKNPTLQGARMLSNIPFVCGDDPINREAIAPGNKTIMTIASYGHTPNVVGVDWFLNKVWPLVIQAVPDANFSIYGSQMSEALKVRWAMFPNVQAIGFVEKVADAYRNCSLAVCTVLSGAGTNIKVIEAGMHRRQCVLTDSASRGFSSDSKLNGILKVGKSAEQVATHITEILNTPTKNQEDADQFCQIIQQNYSYEHFSSVVRQTVIEAIDCADQDV